MKKVNDMSLKEILDITNVILYSDDIVHFCDNTDVRYEFMRRYKDFGGSSKKIKKFLLDNEEYIDKEKFVLLLAQNYKENLEIIDDQNEHLKRQLKNHFSSKEILNELSKGERQKKLQTKYFKSTVNLAKDVEKIIDLYYYDEEKNRYVIKIIDSKRFLYKKDQNNTKNKRRFDRIDNDLKEKDVDHESGIEYIITSLMPTDFYKVFPNNNMGRDIITMVQENEVLRRGIKTNRELYLLKTENKIKEYSEALNSIKFEDFLTRVKDALREYSDYLDIDKLLLISVYRYNEGLESKEYPIEAIESIKEILTAIKDNIDKKAEISCYLKDITSNKDVNVNYSVKDIENCLKRFIDGKYLTNDDINNEKENLINGNTKLADINSQLLGLINLTEEEKDTVMYSNLENFIYGVKTFDYSINQIINKLNESKNIPLNDAIRCLYDENKLSVNSAIDLYNKGTIGREFFKKFSEEVDTSSEINIKKINEEYLKIKEQQQPSEEEKSKLNTLLELYKIVNIDGKTQEEKEEQSNDIMYEIAEDFEDENDLLFYYKNGLLTLNTVAEWSGDKLIEQLYNESEITDQDLIDLYNNKKISNKLIESNILNENTSYYDLMELINNGCISQDKIVDLYMQGKIFDIDFEEMLNNRLISHDKYYYAVSSRTKEELEKNSEIKFAPDLINIPDKKDIKLNIEEKTSDIPGVSRKNKTMIDPNIRYDFFKKLGALQANPIELEETNAFYNYEFFVIPNAEGKLDLNSVVIAERFYDDKEAQDKFALDNATYFFQYKDLMVNSNLPKKEMTNERDKIIFKANHRSGSWAVSVLYKIAQTMASSDFKEFKPGDERAEHVIEQLEKICTPDQIKEILDLTKEIDDDEKYTYELVNDSYAKKEAAKRNKKGFDQTDDDNQR